MPSSSFSFNSNNNYEVERVQELDVNNPSFIKLSATSFTPFIEIKITPTNSQSNPVLASNIKIDSIIPDFTWEGSTQIPQACEPPPPPHSANSSLQHATSILITPGSTCTGFSDFTGQSNLPQQGPYSAENDSTDQSNQIILNGVSWSEIVLIEVYEANDGTLVNDSFSPEILEDYNAWDMYSGGQLITNNIYPKYVKAFVYLNFGSNGIAGLTTDTTLNLDIDEVEPIYGCTDPLSTDYDPTVTIDDGSCSYPSAHGVDVVISVENSPSGISNGPYTDGSTFTMAGMGGASYTTTDVAGYLSNGYGNIQLEGEQVLGTTTKTITLPLTYSPGDAVSYTVQFYVYPSYPILGYNNHLYDFPFGGGPSLNISSTPSEVQRMYFGWGDTKNNLTAASLRIRQPFIPTTWEEPIYATNNNNSPAPSYWHWVDDPTGSRPTRSVSFNNFAQSDTFGSPNITSLISAFEEYGSDFNVYTGKQWFPEKVLISITLDFIMPSNLSYNQAYEIPVNIYHNTENQGDFNWTAPVSGCTDPLADNYDPNATIDDGSCAYVNPI